MLALLAGFAALGSCQVSSAATGWIPPGAITVLVPGATFAPGSTHTIEMTVRANGVSAGIAWSATGAGQFPLILTPKNGTLTVPADSIRNVTLSVFLPDTAVGVSVLRVTVTDQVSAGFITRATNPFYSATGGRPEVWPSPSTWAASANTTGVVSFLLHSLLAGAESLSVTSGRANPDANNTGALFPGSPPAAKVFIPGGATLTVNAPTTIAGSAYGGNANAVQLTVASNGGLSLGGGNALNSAALPESLPTALFPIGLVPAREPVSGRDGLAELPGRGLWLVPSGLDGVRVMKGGSSLTSIGPLDANADGTDDRLVGQIRIPSFAASLSVVPGFIGPAGDTLDLGLLAAGRAGLMLLDLRTVLDYPFGTWEDFFDLDMNGIDDRIVRSIPLSGFATDVAWFRAPSGRIVALVAEADTGSVPVAASYNPASVIAGTGAGVVAIDVTAAYDSLGAVSYAAGTLPTPGSALDLELRLAGTGAPDLAVADGAAGVSVYHLGVAAGAPATITYTPLGSVALSSAWGTPYARDACWISNTADSAYLAVAASAGGLQIVRAPPAGAPSLVLSQQTSAPAIGLAGAGTGEMAAALGAGGTALMRVPRAGELDQIAPAAAPLYAAPVTLARGQRWTEGRPLEAALHWTPGASATSLCFFSGSGPVPDLLVADGLRSLVLRPGWAIIVGVAEERTPPRAAPLAVSAAPNPLGDRTEIRVFDASAKLGSGAAIEANVFDVQGRLVVRNIRARMGVSGGGGRSEVSATLARFLWDGRDDRGQRLSSGRYWLRVRQADRSATLPILILR